MSAKLFPRPLAFPEPPPYSAGAGLKYAIALAERGQRHSYRLLLIGWVCVISAGLFALLGTTARTEFEIVKTSWPAASSKATKSEGELRPSDIITLGSGAKNWLNAHLGVLFGALAIIAAGIGWNNLDRASAAALLACAATKAIGQVSSTADEAADLIVYRMCIEAKSAWLEGRMNQDRIGAIAQSFFGERLTRGAPAPPFEPKN